MVHGASGYRSSIGAGVIRRHGFVQIADLVGGIGDWEGRLGRMSVASLVVGPALATGGSRRSRAGRLRARQ
jgi:hypothetical protein